MVIANSSELRIAGTFEYKKTQREFEVWEVDSSEYIASLQPDARLSVLATLARTKHGFSVDLVTPIIGTHVEDKAQARLSYIKPILNKVMQLDPGTFQPLIDAEVTQSDKVGPLSIMLPFEQRRAELYRYYAIPKVNADSFRKCVKAYESIKSGLPSHKFSPLSLQEAFTLMPKGTNLGAPFFRKSPDKYPDLMRLAMRVEKEGFNVHKFNDPCMLYWRGQPTGLKTPTKQRAVWGYPHYITLHEQRIMAPITAYFKTLPEFAALVSREAVNKEITKLIALGKVMYSIDFSSFDQFAQPFMDMVIGLMAHMFKRSGKSIIEFVGDRYKNIALLHPDGIWYGPHGIPSGAGPTNWGDSVINEIIAKALGAERWLVQGDDAVMVFSKDPGIEYITEFVTGLGMYVGVDKGGISRDNVTYLQNVHMRSYTVDGLNVGVRPIERALSGLLGFETPRDKAWRPVDTTFRWLQQAENLKEHPSFVIAARLLIQNDRLLREFNILELIELGGGLSEIEAREKVKGFPYGKESLTNLTQFAIVKEIEKLRKELNGKVPSGDWWAA